ncbi:MAG: class I SAM-dependent methyltransferase [Myxococcales bacterium]|nr:class I SAM-dependent methyltransferase [Myxococcales bacterium]
MRASEDASSSSTELSSGRSGGRAIVSGCAESHIRPANVGASAAPVKNSLAACRRRASPTLVPSVFAWHVPAMPDPTSTLTHLLAHHRDFEDFRALMQETSAGRFGAIWWGVWQQYVAPVLPPTGLVIDLGCGPGGLFAPLRKVMPEVRIVGVEVQPAMLRAARELAIEVGATIVEADLNGALPLPDNVADVVTAVHVLHELPFPVPLLREALRVLRPGGAFLLFDWVRQPLRQYTNGAVLTPDLLQHFREHCLFTADDLAYLCDDVGFRVLEVIGRRNNQYAMLACVKPAAA